MEAMLMDFVVWLVTCRPSGKSISSRSVAKYVSHVRLWHLVEFKVPIMGDLDTQALRDVIRGVARLNPQVARARRWGVRTQDLKKAMDRFLGDDTPLHATWAAALSTAFCGLMRGAEFALQPGQRWDPITCLTRADLKFRRAADGSLWAIIRMRPAKRLGATKSVPLMLRSGGSLIDPVRALQRMLALDPVAEEDEASTPLFRIGREAITVDQTRTVVKGLMQRLGLDSDRFGAHSLRIGGASAALAAGLSPSSIRMAGRWGSDIYEIYCRISKESAAAVATVIGSTAFEDLERGVQFCDEELVFTTDDAAMSGREAWLEQDMLADLAAGGEDEA